MASSGSADSGEDIYAPLPVRLGGDSEPRAWVRGVCYTPDGEFFAIDASNCIVIKYARDVSMRYRIVTKCKVSHRPRDIAYLSTFWNGLPFEGVVVTVESNMMVYLTLSLEIWRLVKTNGDYSGVCRLPNTNLLVVVNAKTSSADVITVYGQTLYSYRMPNHICRSPGYVAVAMLAGNPVVVVSCQAGLVCLRMDWSASRHLSCPQLKLLSVQRYSPPNDEKFKPEGVCAFRSHVIVADFDGNRIVKFRLLSTGGSSNRVNLYKMGEFEVQEPLALDVAPLDQGAAQIGVARQKGRPPGFHRLKFINTTVWERAVGESDYVDIYSASSSTA